MATPTAPPRPADGFRLPRPVARFLHDEAAGGAVLVVAAVVALVWANSPWRAVYDALWGLNIRLEVGTWHVGHDLRHWVNDGLMTLFFFVVGLEIKRELVTGELRDRRAATLPALAAVGGMVVPAAIYALWNMGGEGSAGWGIPMATDIAFAAGVLALVGRSAPSSLKVFLLSLAIVDDIGAIAVIAIFYSDTLHAAPLVTAGVALAVMGGLRLLKVTSIVPYVLMGIVVWFGVGESGIHATIAGVVLGLLAPARPRAAEDVVREWAEDLQEPAAGDAKELARLVQGTVSVAERLQHDLHPWTSFVVVPVFALANAGVPLSGGAVGDAVRSPVALGIVAGLVVGKVVGIVGAVFLAVRLRLASLPVGSSWGQVAGVGLLGGIGFTVSLFVTDLAFDAPALQDQAKVGVLIASVLASAAGAAVLAVAGGTRRRGIQTEGA